MTTKPFTRSVLCECARPIPDIDSGDCVKCGHTLLAAAKPAPARQVKQVRRQRIWGVSAPLPAHS
jgi:hypothetical protein